MDLKTHNKINEKLSGVISELKKDFSRISLKTTSDMIVDGTGLIHGGFIFSVADFAAMTAINHPNVVLGGANVKFLKPVVEGDEIIAEATLKEIEGKKNIVSVIVKKQDLELVFSALSEEECYLGTYFFSQASLPMRGTKRQPPKFWTTFLPLCLVIL